MHVLDRWRGGGPAAATRVASVLAATRHLLLQTMTQPLLLCIAMFG
jgi:hypothetical protein